MKHKGLIIAVASGLMTIVVMMILFADLFGSPTQELIYVVSKTKSENSTFWHSVERGVQVAGDEIGVEVMFVGPEREVDLKDQIELVEKGIAMKPAAIVLAASDYNALVDVSEAVVDAGIPFITVDSDVNMKEAHSFIATNSQEAAGTLGDILIDLIGGEGRVAMVSHLKGTTSAIDREAGFRESIEANEAVTLLSEVPYSNNDSGVAYGKTVELLKKYPDLRGIFGTNEATLIGIARAVDEEGMSGEVKVVGFDISMEAAGYLEKNVIQAIVIQRPFNMGYLSVLEAYEQFKRGKDPETLYVDVVLVTKENMFDEEIQKFLIPFLE